MNTDQASHIAGMFQAIGLWMRQHAADNPTMAAAAEGIGKRIMQAAEDLKSMGDDYQPPAEPPADPAPADPPAEAPVTAPDDGTPPVEPDTPPTK